jgi:hypothetical protein
MESIVEDAQGLVYRLLCRMPSMSRKDSRPSSPSIRSHTAI